MRKSLLLLLCIGAPCLGAKKDLDYISGTYEADSRVEMDFDTGIFSYSPSLDDNGSWSCNATNLDETDSADLGSWTDTRTCSINKTATDINHGDIQTGLVYAHHKVTTSDQSTQTPYVEAEAYYDIHLDDDWAGNPVGYVHDYDIKIFSSANNFAHCESTYEVSIDPMTGEPDGDLEVYFTLDVQVPDLFSSEGTGDWSFTSICTGTAQTYRFLYAEIIHPDLFQVKSWALVEWNTFTSTWDWDYDYWYNSTRYTKSTGYAFDNFGSGSRLCYGHVTANEKIDGEYYPIEIWAEAKIPAATMEFDDTDFIMTNNGDDCSTKGKAKVIFSVQD